ncbi:hypothetical protein SDC9_149343 [bioreactor metagenome]|uniref:Uncharacterized protein n=1 Tax=bioreactor metagenome TaxID=1076179 RepID=A0A645ELC4_9ZZZZ
MRNIDNGNALFTQSLNDRKQPLNLRFGERCGRFIHDDDLGLCRNRLCNLNNLFFGNTKTTHALFRADTGFEIFQNCDNLLDLVGFM